MDDLAEAPIPEAPIPEAYVAHRSAARLRLRVPSRRLETEFLERVGKQLASALGLDAVEINPLTGSILLHTDNVEAVAQLGEENQLFRLVQQHRRAPVRAKRASARSGRRLSGANGAGAARSALGLGLAGAGLVQLARGEILAPAATLWWYAGELLHLWGGSEALPTPEGAIERLATTEAKNER